MMGAWGRYFRIVQMFLWLTLNFAQQQCIHLNPNEILKPPSFIAWIHNRYFYINFVAKLNWNINSWCWKILWHRWQTETVEVEIETKRYPDEVIKPSVFRVNRHIGRIVEYERGHQQLLSNNVVAVETTFIFTKMCPKNWNAYGSS